MYTLLTLSLHLRGILIPKKIELQLWKTLNRVHFSLICSSFFSFTTMSLPAPLGLRRIWPDGSEPATASQSSNVESVGPPYNQDYGS